MILTYFGHSGFLLDTGHHKILIDPFISGNPIAENIDIYSIQANYILLTHGHSDHVLDAEVIAKKNKAKIISNFEIVSWYESKGIEGHPMNIGGKWDFDFGTIKCTNAVHSSVLPDGTYGGNPMGFVIELANMTIYIAGDTALTWDMKLIPVTCPKIDWAVLPLGDNFTMNYKEALLASDFVECNNIIGCHYDTFGFIRINHREVSQYFVQKGKNLILPKIGDRIKLLTKS
ncbi:MAG: metal-dependent hydrolase [Saprospiraceae bacterium]|nr:metal-dependent hydrolase [Saprospiraceae bacterium]